MRHRGGYLSSLEVTLLAAAGAVIAIAAQALLTVAR